VGRQIPAPVATRYWQMEVADKSYLSMSQRPRIVFLIAIAPPERIKDWHLACANFKQTLSSIFNSTDGNYCVAVAGHQAPAFQLPQDPRFKFLSLDHPLQSLDDGRWIAAVKDKMIKLAAAWDYAKSTWNPQYVMRLDWDDLVSSKLVEWLVSAKDEAGFRIKYGWIWRSSLPRLIQCTECFDRASGSCLIIRSDLADKTGPFLHTVDGIKFDEVSQQIEASDPYGLVPGAGTGTLLLNDTTNRAEAQFAYLGHRLAIVPFKAAVYRLGHGNNASGRHNRIQTMRMFLGCIRRTRPVTPSLRREFMLG
jgi:hypothetical protein